MPTSDNSSTRQDGQVSPTNRQAPATVNAAAFPKPGTAEWGQMNRRRAELIRKNLRGELSAEEREEYETLQRMSLAALEASFPRYGEGEPPREDTEATEE